MRHLKTEYPFRAEVHFFLEKRKFYVKLSKEAELFLRPTCKKSFTANLRKKVKITAPDESQINDDGKSSGNGKSTNEKSHKLLTGDSRPGVLHNSDNLNSN